MNKKELLTELTKMSKDLGNIISYIEKQSVMKKDGKLLVCANDDVCYLYHVTGDGKRVYLGKDKADEIKSLSQKAHYSKMLGAAIKEKTQIDRCIRTLSSGSGITDIDDVYPSLNAIIRKQVGPFTMTDDGYERNWLKKNGMLRNSRKLGGQNKTLKGEFVKSKSEVIIADRMTYYGVPYVYEITTARDAFDEMHYPDFFILNKRTKQEFFWEHLGKMGDPQYAARNQVKMEQFARQGIIPGKNLIVSFECGDRPLSTEYVDSIIKELLI